MGDALDDSAHTFAEVPMRTVAYGQAVGRVVDVLLSSANKEASSGRVGRANFWRARVVAEAY